MTDVTTAADTGAAAEPSIPVAPAPAEPAIDAREAARSLTTWRHKQRQEQAAPEKPAGEQRQEAQQPTTESTAGDEPTGESAAETPPAQTEGVDRQKLAPAEAGEPAPIEPPRSWTKEDKELFNALPRETQ